MHNKNLNFPKKFNLDDTVKRYETPKCEPTNQMTYMHACINTYMHIYMLYIVLNIYIYKFSFQTVFTSQTNNRYSRKFLN